VGSITSQLILILASPVFTRIFSKAEFAEFALFSAIVGCFGSIICARLDLSIVIAKRLADSKRLLGMSLFMTVVISTIGLLMAVLVKFYFSNFKSVEILSVYIYLIPIALTFYGGAQAFISYCNRINAYKEIITYKIFLSVFTVSSCIFFGYYNLGNGLIGGVVSSLFFSVTYFFYIYKNLIPGNIFAWDKKRFLLAKKYKNIVKYSIPTAIIDNITVSLPIFFLTNYFSDNIVGNYALMIRIAQSPISIISQAVSQVSIKKISDIVHQGISPLRYIINLGAFLLVLISPIALIVWLYAPKLFSIFFGPQWAASGEYLQILIFSLVFRSIISVLSGALIPTGHVKLCSIWQVLYFCATIVLYYLTAPNLEIISFIYVMMYADILLYSIYLLIIMYGSRNPLTFTVK
jgi:O-antigen/teichoic acid export membrane protein